MSIDVIYGYLHNSAIYEDIENLIQDSLEENILGTLYFGYPILIRSHTGEKIGIEALLITNVHGVLAFTESNLAISDVNAAQDEIYNKLHSKLFEYPVLTKSRNLIPNLQVATYCSSSVENIPVPNNEILINSSADLQKVLADMSNVNNNDVYIQVNSVMESLISFKDNKAREAKDEKSLGWAMNQIEQSIASLDREQKRAALEIGNKPQRIRGLAGSGKTIVLALKAAYLHVQNPSKKICITYNTRSLRDQFVDLITRFTFEHIKDKPNWNQIEIIHAWGSHTTSGVYSQIAKTYNKNIYDLKSAMSTFGYDDAFKGSCDKLLDEIRDENNVKMFDIVLIDEAQDLPRSFFELIFKVVDDEQKHIVWAYDELQTIGKYTIDSPEVLFGSGVSGAPNIKELKNELRKPRQDIVLKKCYRNPPWVLSLAHALGFGIHRKKGLIQSFDDPDFWQDIGYAPVDCCLSLGHEVTLERDTNYIPDFFRKYIQMDNSIRYKSFSSQKEQYEEVVKDIKDNLAVDELSPRDILIINANPITTKSDTALLRVLLSENGIDNHLAGVTSSVDDFFLDGKVTISGIYRAKGNEAPIVYIINSHYCFDSLQSDIVKKRNILFTAMTRSRGYVRIYGCGENMDGLIEEIKDMQEDSYQLKFKYPTSQELLTMRTLYKGYNKELIATVSSLERIINSADADVINTLDSATKEKLLRMLNPNK